MKQIEIQQIFSSYFDSLFIWVGESHIQGHVHIIEHI